MSRFILPYQRVDDSNGHPLDGAQLFFFEEGTSTPKDTYSDENFVTPNANPVIADSQGQFGDIFLNGVYRTELQDKNDVTQPDYPADGVGEDQNVLASKELIADTVLFIDETDVTKKMQFDLTAISTGTTRTLTVPDRSGIIDVFPSGTKIVFYQASAPAGWTKDATHNDKALRVVSGSGGGSGGSDSISSPPTHTHTGTSHTHGLPIGGNGSKWAFDLNQSSGTFTSTDSVGAAGGGAGGETKLLSDSGGGGSTGATQGFAPKYIDVIVCTKD